MQGYLRYYLAKIFLGSPNLFSPWVDNADTHLVFQLGYTRITLPKIPTHGVGIFVKILQ